MIKSKIAIVGHIINTHLLIENKTRDKAGITEKNEQGHQILRETIITQKKKPYKIRGENNESLTL